MEYRFVKKVVFVAIVFLASISCSKDEQASLASVIGANPDAPTPGVISSTAGFNIKVNPPLGANYIVHRADSFDNKCVVESTATAFADKDIQCILEVEELEGSFHGIDMVLNVPPSMCTYIRYEPYYFFGLRTADGPTAVSVTLNADGGVTASSVTPPSGGQVLADGSVRCTYDYSSVDNGPNCCTGTYTLTKNNNGAITVETGVSWGGKPGNCVTGAGADILERFKDTEMPRPIIYFKPNGFSESFKVDSSLETRGDSLYYANYFTGTTPAAFQSGSNPYYSWTCLDDAYDVKYRIRVQIREWNQMAQFLLKASGNPDTTGLETDWSSDINDLPDWLDIFTGGDIFPGMTIK